jgi:hypothetical protein
MIPGGVRKKVSAFIPTAGPKSGWADRKRTNALIISNLKHQISNKFKRFNIQ